MDYFGIKIDTLFSKKLTCYFQLRRKFIMLTNEVNKTAKKMAEQRPIITYDNFQNQNLSSRYIE